MRQNIDGQVGRVFPGRHAKLLELLVHATKGDGRIDETAYANERVTETHSSDWDKSFIIASPVVNSSPYSVRVQLPRQNHPQARP